MTIEEKAKEYCPDDAYPFGPDIINKEVRKAFIAGWKAKEESEKHVPNDLEQAADEMALRAFPEKKSYSTVIDRVVDYNAVDRKNYRDGIIAGAKWDRSQMLKEAVAEVEVGMRGDPIEIILDKYVQRAMGIFPGDKVRIIIVKED